MLTAVGFITTILIGISECVNIAEPLGHALCKSYGEHIKSKTMPDALKDPNKYPMPEKETCTRYKWMPGKCKMEGCKRFMNITCGSKKKGARILGGVGTKGKQFPFVVQIRWEPTERGRPRGKCSGALIAKRWVITSAQCAMLSLRRRNMQPTHSPGLVTFADDISIASCQENSWEKAEPYYVISVEIPSQALVDIEKLAVANPHWDVALLKLNKVVKNKTPLRLPKVGRDNCEENLVMVGWGRTKKDTGRDEINPAKVVAKQGLFKAEIERYADDQCTTILSNLYEYNSDQQMCGYTTTPDTEGCSSDCGGPVLSHGLVKGDEKIAGLYYLCGVITRPSCEKGQIADRATIIKAIDNEVVLKWIETTMLSL